MIDPLDERHSRAAAHDRQLYALLLNAVEIQEERVELIDVEVADVEIGFEREQLDVLGQKLRLRDERLRLLPAGDEQGEVLKAAELLDEGAEELKQELGAVYVQPIKPSSNFRQLQIIVGSIVKHSRLLAYACI